MGGCARQEDRREKEEADEDAGALDRLPPVYPRKRDETGWKLSDRLLAVGIGRVRDGFADFDFIPCTFLFSKIYVPFIYLLPIKIRKDF